MFDNVGDYVKARGGNRPIKKVLVANNGIGAVKAIRSMRRWAYETFSNERAVQFVVMASPEDMRANAEYIRMADEIVDVPGGSNNNNYANVMLIVEIAERWGVDAVWAGWGHASENPRLPDSLAKTARNIVFIGPSGGPMMALGDKIGSTIIAQSAGVPCIGWNGDGLVTNYKENGIPPELYAQANVTSAEEACKVCDRIGYPVMIKASEGGGGKGIRKVLESGAAAAAYRQVAGEIPGSPIFVMKLAPKSRHLEVQLLADNYGQAIALNGRDCSVQRRHQKIIEEGPPVVAPKDQWRKMELAAINLAKEVGYSNAGTVEYLYTEDDNKFYFLELNPRLQVEHPVTEMITKVNLPAAQLQVAMGIPLHMIPDIRKLYGKEALGTDSIDFETEERMKPTSHCIAVRITAENPDLGFQPTSGTIQELNFRSTPDVWGYFSVDSSGLVHEFADSQFGHLFAGGVDRDSARKSMVIALKELSIRGDIRTTVEYIGDLMSSDDFIHNRIDTAWLDRRIQQDKETGKGGAETRRLGLDGPLAVTIGAVITTQLWAAKQSGDFCSMVGKGLLPPKELSCTSLAVELIYEGTKYELRCSQAGPKTFTVECGGGYVQAECRSLADGGYLVVIGGKSHVVYYNEVAGGGLRLAVNGTTVSFTQEYDPACLEADVAGKLARCLVPDGAHLNAGEPYAEIEVMKMFMPVTVKEPGTIRWALSEGASIKPGTRIATLELDDPSSVTKAAPFTGKLAVAATDRSVSLKPHVLLRNAIHTLETVLWGYEVPEEVCTESLKNLWAAVCDPFLALHEFEEALYVLSGRIDASLFEHLKQCADAYRAKCEEAANTTTTSMVFPVEDILPVLDDHASQLKERDRGAFLTLIESLRTITEQHAHGVAGRTVYALLMLVRQYLAVERAFAGGLSLEDCIRVLKQSHAGDLAVVHDMVRSHFALNRKNQLLLTLLEDIGLAMARARKGASISQQPVPRQAIDTHGKHQSSRHLIDPVDVPERHATIARDMSAFVPVLTEISNLTDDIYAAVAAKARALLIEESTPSVAQRRGVFADAVELAVQAGDDVTHRQDAIAQFVSKNVPVRDVLLQVLSHSVEKEGSSDLTGARVSTAAEMYIQQIYRSYDLTNFTRSQSVNIWWTSFNFSSQHPESLPPGVNATTSFADLASLVRTISTPSGSLANLGAQGSATPPVTDRKAGLAALMDEGNAGSDTESASSAFGSNVGEIGTEHLPPSVVRCGVCVVAKNLSALSEAETMTAILSQIPQFSANLPGPPTGPVNVLHILLLNDAKGLSSPGTTTPPMHSGGPPPPSPLSKLISTGDGSDMADAVLSGELKLVLAGHTQLLKRAGIRRATFLVGSQSDIPSIFTFRSRSTAATGDDIDYKEDTIFRHIEPSHAYNLDLPRLANFAIRLASTAQATGGNVHVYAARPQTKKGAEEPLRYFARVVSQTREFMGEQKRYYVEKMFVEALSALDLVISKGRTVGFGGIQEVKPPGSNHIFINCVTPDPSVDPSIVANHMKQLMQRFGDKITRLGITHFEMKIICRVGSTAEVPMRLVASNPTGYVVHVDLYVEVTEGKKVVFRSIGLRSPSESYEGLMGGTTVSGGGASAHARADGMGREWEGQYVDSPYPVTRKFEGKRKMAMLRSETLYCYDYLELIESALRDLWEEFAADRPHARIVCPDSVMYASELVVSRKSGGINTKWVSTDPDLQLEELQRPAGLNDVSMVAWMLTLRTPEYPGGRQMVLIANDITHEAGSFGTREDTVFLLASRYARLKGIPRIYLAANSGARIGMAETVKKCFNVAWADPKEPTLGYKYLYLSEPDYQRLSARGAVKCEKVTDEASGGTHWRITDIIGEESDLGVENLQGSGAIAGETSLAYSDVFTLTLVVGRSVGIGAYLVRLGQRTIQNVVSAPIILTGYQALNTLMGSDVYTSNDQLGGGTAVMGPNGVAHILSETHFEAVKSALKWLSYVPSLHRSYLPVVDVTGVDMVERSIDFCPSKATVYDPRHLLAGVHSELDGEWVSGFFDRGSFTETLSRWAETVVCGRGRLGGIPMGVVITESRQRSKRIPADPADLLSQEKVVQQAGGVWFPDSAHKTAQAIRDFNGEGLPLMIMANWRGFSGGQRDMFDEILKFGAEIVDALVAYKQPAFVYIPPFAELRGGAWVVVDSTINPEVMEMYAAEEARGGVLEANGAASIKFREKDVIAAAHRLDAVLIGLDTKLNGTNLSRDEVSALKTAIKARERKLSGVYAQLAVQFADLHDTPGRMEAVGVIRKIVPWSQARSFFYWRLRRRLAEFDLRRQVIKAWRSGGSQAAQIPKPAEASNVVKGWFVTMGHTSQQWEEDKVALAWMAKETKAIKERVSQIRFEAMALEAESIAKESPEAVLKGLLAAMANFDDNTKRTIMETLNAAAV